MTIIQKIALAAVLAAALTIILRKALAYERSSRAERAAQIPTLHPVADATPREPEPLRPDDLRVAQNAPL